MGKVAIFGREEVLAALGPPEARAAIGTALRAGPQRLVPRTSVPFGDGELLLMPADNAKLAGVKVLTLAPPPAGGPGAEGARTPRPTAQGLYVLFDARTLLPLAAFDAGALTELRTAAVSAWVVDLLAPDGAATLALFGSGAQARAHLAALAAVRPLKEVLVLARREDGAVRLLSRAGELGMAARRANAAQVAEADIVCCCTSSATPLFDGGSLRPGTFVVAIGSHRPDRREVDSACVGRSVVVVETRAAALAEAGDLSMAVSEGAFSPENVAADLYELARGAVPARAGRDLTLFKSVGAAFEDLAVAEALWERLR